MKRICAVILTLLILLSTAACGKSAKGEDMYFIGLQEVSVTGEGYVKEPFEVIHYAGGENYEAVYELDSHVACVYGSTLYYYENYAVCKAELPNGEPERLVELPERLISKLMADENGVYAMQDTSVYKLGVGSYEQINENEIAWGPQKIALGDGGLFYVDDVLGVVRYDTASGEMRQLVDVRPITVEYDNGFVYVTGKDGVDRIDINTGEMTPAHDVVGGVIHDGWMYSIWQNSDENGSNDIFRRKLGEESDTLCGSAPLPEIGFYGADNVMVFGEKGFIVQCTKEGEPNRYMYFTYGKTGGTVLERSCA